MNKKNGLSKVFVYNDDAILSEPLIVKLIAWPKTTQIIEIERIPLRTFRDELAWCVKSFRDYCNENIDILCVFLVNSDDTITKTNNVSDMTIVTQNNHPYPYSYPGTLLFTLPT